MKASLIVSILLMMTVIAAALTYQTASRDWEYRVLLGRGDAALRDDETLAAITAYSGAIALKSDSLLAHLRRGETHQRRGDLEAAARDFQTAAALDPMATRALEELADVRYLQQRYGRAAEIYEEALRLDDRAARVSYKLALARYREGRSDLALPALDAALRLDERMADAHYLQALCLRDQQRPTDAQRALEKAVALSPGLIAAREELADLYGSLGRRSEQLDQLQMLAGLDRNHLERQLAVGQAHARWANDQSELPARRASQADLAVLTLGAALERLPDEPQIYSALGHVWLDIALDRGGDVVALGKAVEALERAASSDNATSETLMLYGRALLQGGRADQGERALRQALERSPVEPAALLFYADAAEQQKHLDAARNALVRYVALVDDDEGFPSRAARIADLSLKLNDRPTADVWIKRGRDRAPDDAAWPALEQRVR